MLRREDFKTVEQLKTKVFNAPNQSESMDLSTKDGYEQWLEMNVRPWDRVVFFWVNNSKGRLEVSDQKVQELLDAEKVEDI